MALELALAVQQEIATRLEEADRLRHSQVERAAYEVDRARHRSLQVDPATPPRERKRLAALVIEDVTVRTQREITAAVRFRGGATSTVNAGSAVSEAFLRP